ncbi:MAG: 50S ribosomal protein L25 [Victivallaceae bacterium]|nr:50S ribosomal protein L25 [Victivallaceae bacterium]
MSTASHEIAVQTRSEFGKNASRRARHAGLVPANVYGKGKQPQALMLNAGDWESLATHDLNLVYLIEGDKRTAVLVKEVQYNYLKSQTVHVDFQEVDLNKEVHAEVRVHLIGQPVGEAHGGVLEQEIHMLPVCCKPQDLPDAIRVDVAALDLGDVMLVSQVVLPDGVKTLAEADAIVCHVVRPAEEPEPEVAAPEGAEPEVITAKKGEEEGEKAEDKGKKAEDKGKK